MQRYPSTGNRRNAAALLRRFGRAVYLFGNEEIQGSSGTPLQSLVDATVYQIRGFFRELPDENNVTLPLSERRYSYRVWIPEVELESVPSSIAAKLATQGGVVGIDNDRDRRFYYRVVDWYTDEDDWIEISLSRINPSELANIRVL